MQTALSKHGFPDIKIDGKFGQETVDAVEAFQAKNGIGADGAVGKDTRSKLGL